MAKKILSSRVKATLLPVYEDISDEEILEVTFQKINGETRQATYEDISDEETQDAIPGKSLLYEDISDICTEEGPLDLRVRGPTRNKVERNDLTENLKIMCFNEKNAKAKHINLKVVDESLSNISFFTVMENNDNNIILDVMEEKGVNSSKNIGKLDLNINSTERIECERYMCNKCDYKTKHRGNLMAHIKSIHEGIKYACDKCDYKTRNRGTLRQHKDSIHNGVRYICDYCGYKASLKSNLRRHIKSIHEGVKYNCDQCPYKASTQSYLQNHIRSVHEGIKYDCDQCIYKANTRHVLHQHIESVHRGVSYDCDQCDYKVTQKQNLKRHKQKVHILQ